MICEVCSSVAARVVTRALQGRRATGPGLDEIALKMSSEVIRRASFRDAGGDAGGPACPDCDDTFVTSSLSQFTMAAPQTEDDEPRGRVAAPPASPPAAAATFLHCLPACLASSLPRKQLLGMKYPFRKKCCAIEHGVLVALAGDDLLRVVAGCGRPEGPDQWNRFLRAGAAARSAAHLHIAEADIAESFPASFGAGSLREMVLAGPEEKIICAPWPAVRLASEHIDQARAALQARDGAAAAFACEEAYRALGAKVVSPEENVPPAVVADAHVLVSDVSGGTRAAGWAGFVPWLAVLPGTDHFTKVCDMHRARVAAANEQLSRLSATAADYAALEAMTGPKISIASLARVELACRACVAGPLRDESWAALLAACDALIGDDEAGEQHWELGADHDGEAGAGATATAFLRRLDTAALERVRTRIRDAIQACHAAADAAGNGISGPRDLRMEIGGAEWWVTHVLPFSVPSSTNGPCEKAYEWHTYALVGGRLLYGAIPAARLG